jgi:hypothetical protein
VKEPRVHGPAPSIWPVTLATGVALVALGVLTSWLILVAGLLLATLALVGWIAKDLGSAQ